MLEPVWAGLLLLLGWPALGFLALGVLVGVLFGAVPGLSGIVGMVMVLPFTFGMEPVAAFSLLLGVYAVTTTGDTIASVLLGIPGTAASQATILDGYPLARDGQAARALGAAFTVSAIGGVFGGIILALSLPLARPIITAFGSPEIFMLGLFGLTMVAALSSGSISKGIAAALFGLLLGAVGYADGAPIPRYSFDSVYLLGGIPLVPAILGLFAIPELLELASRNTSIARRRPAEGALAGILTGIRDVVRHRWLVLRSSMIGSFVGILPGLGAAVVDWIAYGHAVHSAKDKSQFGKGDIRGVIAPEAANNASKGGSLIPMVAFGIPGSLGTAILLGALLIQGLTPGPNMLTTELPLTFSMVWAIIIANIAAAVLLILCVRYIAKLTVMPGHLIVPAVLLFVLMAAWLQSNTMGDWMVFLAMGVIGVAMRRGGWPRPPIVLALVLFPILENSYQLSVRAHDGLGWLNRPIVLVLIALLIVGLAISVRSHLRSSGTPTAAAADSADSSAERNVLVSWSLSAGLLVLFAVAAWHAIEWPRMARLFPLTIALPGVVLVVWILATDTKAARGAICTAGGGLHAMRKAKSDIMFWDSVSFLAYIIAILALSYIVGQILAICAFVFVYLLRWGGYSVTVAGLYTLAAAGILYGFYGQTLDVIWHQSLLFS